MNEKDRKSRKIKDGLYTIFFMFFITVVFISIISFIYVKTRSKIKLNEQLKLKRAILFAGNIEYDNSNENDILDKYSKYVKEIEVENADNYFEIYKDGAKSGYVFLVTGPGLWGKIDTAIGFKQDLKTMTGIEFLKQNETPGLGARITETWFKEQFENKVAPIEKAVGENKEAGIKEFNAITGATSSSKAVMKIINKSAKNVKKRYDLMEEE